MIIMDVGQKEKEVKNNLFLSHANKINRNYFVEYFV